MGTGCWAQIPDYWVLFIIDLYALLQKVDSSFHRSVVPQHRGTLPPLPHQLHNHSRALPISQCPQRLPSLKQRGVTPPPTQSQERSQQHPEGHVPQSPQHMLQQRGRTPGRERFSFFQINGIYIIDSSAVSGRSPPL